MKITFSGSIDLYGLINENSDLYSENRLLVILILRRISGLKRKGRFSMLLFELVTLSRQLEDHRLVMHSIAEKKGLLDSEVLKASQSIEKLVIRYEKLLSLLSRSHDIKHDH